MTTQGYVKIIRFSTAEQKLKAVDIRYTKNC